MEKQLSINEMANTKNKFAVIVFDETNYWRDDIKKKAKKIESVYLVNLKEPTHLCELAISFPSSHLRNFVHNTKKFTEDELTDIEYTYEDETRYFRGESTPKFVKYYKSGKEDDILEYESGNPSYC